MAVEPQSTPRRLRRPLTSGSDTELHGAEVVSGPTAAGQAEPPERGQRQHGSCPPGDPPPKSSPGELAPARQLLITAAQAGRLLQVPASWLQKKAAAGEIPHHRIGRHLRFSENDLAAILHTGARPVDAGHPSNRP